MADVMLGQGVDFSSESAPHAAHSPKSSQRQRAAFEAARAWSIKQDTEVKMIWQLLHELRMEVNALRHCLFKSGVVTSTRFEIERHRARFEWYVERHPSTLTKNMVADALLKSIAGILINCDGFMASRLDAVSSGFHSMCSHLSRVYAIGGLDMQGKRSLGGVMQAHDTVESLDVLSGDWDRLTPVPTARMRAVSAVAKGKLYLLGGLAGEQALADVDCLDMLTGVWESGLPPMLAARAACAASGASNSKVYVLGGSSDGRHFLNTAESYSESSRSWSPVPQMETPRGAFSVVSLGGKVYALGGLNAQQTLRCCECFDPQAQVWQPLPPMRTARSELAAAAFLGRVIVIGGFSNSGFLLGSVESYSPEKGAWEAMPSLPQPVAACASAVSMGRIYVLGGSDGRRTLQSVQLLVPGESTWRVGPPMRSARMAIAAGTCLAASWAPGGPRALQPEAMGSGAF